MEVRILFDMILKTRILRFYSHANQKPIKCAKHAIFFLIRMRPLDQF